MVDFVSRMTKMMVWLVILRIPGLVLHDLSIAFWPVSSQMKVIGNSILAYFHVWQDYLPHFEALLRIIFACRKFPFYSFCNNSSSSSHRHWLSDRQCHPLLTGSLMLQLPQDHYPHLRERGQKEAVTFVENVKANVMQIRLFHAPTALLYVFFFSKSVGSPN
jgi:hypothetical protein